MCDIYTWMIDENSDFRKVVINKFQTEFETELDKFKSWNGHYKMCSQCGKNLPASSYFFKKRKNAKFGITGKCKSCEGNKFAWGREDKSDLFNQDKKYCMKCDTVYNLSSIYFAKNKDSSDGFYSYCRKCNQASNFGINRGINDVVNVKDGFNICCSCLVELPLNDKYFFKSTHTRIGYEPVCKKCQNIDYGIRYINKVNKNNIPKGYRYCSCCKKLLKEDIFYTNYTICKNCDSFRVHKRRRSYSESDFSIDDWNSTLEEWTENNCIKCAYCGITTKKPTKDHINPFSQGGDFTIGNIIPCCKSCNSSKKDKSIHEFYEYSDSFSQERYNKILNFIKLYI
jgi:hypothetical protein